MSKSKKRKYTKKVEVKPAKIHFLDFSRLIVFLLVLFSISANIYYYLTINRYGVGFGDAWSRVNISRRITDSLNPGLAQIGGVWLPFPQVLYLPFTSIDFLYFNGLAPIFVLSLCYVVGGYYLYRLIKLLTGSRVSGLAGMLLYALNPNILYLQTTGMSEVLFIACMIGASYYWVKYIKEEGNRIPTLIMASFFAFTSSLTRYEGFLFAVCLVILIFLSTWIKTKKYKTAEGTTLVVGVVALLGIFLWHAYSWAIFGDPLNWAKIYSGKKAVVSSVVEVPTDFYGVSENKGKVGAVFSNLGISIFQMSNFLLIPAASVSLIGILALLIAKRDKRTIQTLIVLGLFATPAAFIVFSGLSGGSLIRAPETSLSTLENPLYHSLDEYNVRYGILSMPFVILLISYVFSKRGFLRGLFFGMSFIVSVIGFLHIPVTNYSFAKHYRAVSQDNPKQSFYDWFRSHYDGGLILISVIAHDQDVYNLHIPYKNYIYEGTDYYWRETIKNPTIYARWIIMKSGNKVQAVSGSSDLVSYYLGDSNIVKENYSLLYTDKYFSVYKINDDFYAKHN